MSKNTNTHRNVREIRRGAGQRSAIAAVNNGPQLTKQTLYEVGNLATLGNKWKLKPYQLRRIGLGVVAAAAVVPTVRVAKLAEEHLVWGSEYEMSSAIPTSKAHFDPKKYVIKAIPSSGAFDLAASVDPNHNPQGGVYDFDKQLGGHPAEPGDIVVVPRSPNQ
ncbi:MAG TPA: hypothetical protein VNG32_03350 [Candidatus Dormibacteraeota bacterium]|nr:hypothetical protein [Candidatus Dormibacteraeota bacterium]